jgi:3-oxoacyl-[acyl-carrier protein] reductase
VKQAVLITGSSSGLGLTLARLFDRRGLEVILTGRSKKKLESAALSLSSENEHHIFCGDLTKRPVLDKLFETLKEKKLLPDVVIHNLGGKVSGDAHPLSEDALQRSMQLNLDVAVDINAYYLPKMLERGSGRIIHISSDASLSGQSAPGYAAAKAAVNGYVKSTARFYAKHNIMICAILPGVFEHENSAWSKKKTTDPACYRNKVAMMPLLRFGDSAEMASMILEVACSQSMMCAGSLIQLTGGAL